MVGRVTFEIEDEDSGDPHVLENTPQRGSYRQAVRVDINGRPVGFLRKNDAKRYQARVDANDGETPFTDVRALILGRMGRVTEYVERMQELTGERGVRLGIRLDVDLS